MNDISYIMFSDWAKNGTGFKASGERIRSWIGETDAYVFCSEKSEHVLDRNRSERDLFNSIRSDSTQSIKSSYQELFRTHGGKYDAALIALVPHGEVETEALRKTMRSDSFTKIVVVPLHENELVMDVLRGFEATNLESNEASSPPVPLLVEAAEMMVSEEYNGLSNGAGKDTVIGLIKAFERAGYPADKEVWLAAYFAAGGITRHAITVAKLLDEMKHGTSHRYKTRFRSNIVDILKERISEQD